MVPQSVIGLFPLGELNAHGGDLPRYRGNACQAWAIFNGEKHISLRIHLIIGGKLDSGDIIARSYLGIDAKITVAQIWQSISTQPPILFCQAWELLNTNPSHVLAQQTQDPHIDLGYYPCRPEDGRINWQATIDFLRLVNASSRPYSGAYCRLDDVKLTISQAELVEDVEFFGALPGHFTKVGDKLVKAAVERERLDL